MSEEESQNPILVDLQSKIDDCYDALVTNHEPTRVPENIFTEYYLPKMVNHDTDIINQWVALTGSPTAGATIVDANDEVLFTTPALYDSIDDTAALERKGITIPEIISGHGLRMNNIPSEAATFAAAHLSDKSEQLGSQVVQSDSSQQWNDIFERYGYGKQETSETTQSSLNSNVSDDYD